MTGMGSGLEGRNTVITSAFQHELVIQAIALLIGLVVVASVLFVTWPALKQLNEKLRGGGGRSDDGARRSRDRAQADWSEAPARRFLRLGFGLLWIFDGILQMQSGMPLRMTGQVIADGAAGSPAWLQSVVHWGATIWNNQPVAAASAAVWVQIGIGVWLLLVARGRWSRLGGLVSVGWALNVWVFGESLGGILAPGSSWLFGAPGAVFFYAVAGCLVALPARSWRDRRLGRLVLAGMGVLLLGLAVLQAWPGRGFWQGSGGALQSMVEEMAQTPQPHALSALLGDFATFSGSHAVLLNLLVIAALVVTGVAFIAGHTRIVRLALGVFAVLCVADWVLVQDLGFLGGMGTDPNSALPELFLAIAGYLAIARLPAPVAESPPRIEPASSSSVALRPFARVLALGVAVVMTALGGVTFALAAASPEATTLLAKSIDGPASSIGGTYRPPEVRLVDQRGQPVTLGGPEHKIVLLTNLDPACTNDCPIIAQEFKQADRLLGASADRVELVAIDANPLYRSPAVLRAFDRQERMEQMPNWLYLTGSLRQLRRAWNAFGVEVEVPSGGAMVEHPEEAEILDTRGRLRWVSGFDPGPGTSSTRSSFAATLADAARQVLGESRS